MKAVATAVVALASAVVGGPASLGGPITATAQGITHRQFVGTSSAVPAARRRSRPDETRVIGSSRRGRLIVAERYGSGPVTIFVGGSIHGNEKAGRSLIAAISTPRPLYTLWVIRRMNPDGWARNQRWNAAGVDLNRNFDIGWQPLPCPAKTCSGTGPASEPETVALQAFFLDIRPTLAVFYHSTNNGVDDARLLAAAPTAVDIYAATAHVPVRNFRCAGPCSGTATTWLMTNVPGSTAFVVELPFEDDVMPPEVISRHKAAFWAAAKRARTDSPAPPG